MVINAGIYLYVRLNPYSTGSNSNLSVSFVSCSGSDVLILILLEVTQIPSDIPAAVEQMS